MALEHEGKKRKAKGSIGSDRYGNIDGYFSNVGPQKPVRKKR
jgi:hypothetical protein